MACEEILFHRRAADVKVAVFQTQVLCDIHSILDWKRRSLSLAEDRQFIRQDINIAGGESRILCAGWSSLHEADDIDDVLAAQVLCLLVDWLVALRLEDYLCFPVAVAQVDEDDAAKVSASINPAA